MARITTQIINWLLVYIKIQEKFISFLLFLLTSKNISSKKALPISKTYQYFKVDSMPIIETFKILDYKKLLNDYQNKHGKN